ncbi:MAG: TlpA disulfide reductase family protein [Steroidobacterales bacterium]
MNSRLVHRTGPLLAAAWLLAGAMAAAAPSADPAGVALGRYRAVLTLPAGELPFGLELKREGTATIGYLLNAQERIRLSEVSISGAHMEIQMPGFLNRIIADARDGQLQGELQRSRPGAELQHIALRATLGEHYRFFPAPAPQAANVAGRWAVQFVDSGDGSKEKGVGEFTQVGDHVTGTFLAETGDHRYLEGQVRGDELFLSTFDGAHVFLYHAKLTASGILQGDFWSGLTGHEVWTGLRDEHAALPDAYAMTHMKDPTQRFSVTFPDQSGKPVSTDGPRFRGKVLIVTLAGSWCPNCHDEAAFLEPLYREYRAKGVEVISLMFEYFGDFPQAAAATNRFRQHYGIDYATLIAGISNKEDAATKLPMLDRIGAYPTTIFIDRSGHVRRIHTGFSGPGTGAHYDALVREFRSEVNQLLAGS